MAALKFARATRPTLSIVVPVYNEEESIGPFIKAMHEALRSEPCEFELLFVNDGSTDGTLAALLTSSERLANVRIVNLSRNFGKEAAVSAGLEHSRGDAVIPIDVDLQDPPDLIPKLVQYWREGYDVVYAVRSDRKSDAALKRIPAAWFYRLFNRLAHIQIPENAGDFRLLDRRVVEVLRRLPERTRFMKGLFAWVGFRSMGVPYARRTRASGKSKWKQWRLWNFALEGLFSFSTLPLHLWTYLGLAVAGLAFAYAVFLVVHTLIIGIEVPGYASLATILLFLGGVQLISIGVVGEYLSRIFTEVKGRPLYVVEDVYQHGKPLGRATIEDGS